jgi:toxin-antitoxin system PIN domain toxin
VLLVDANVLLYAVDERASRHGEARDWLDDALEGAEPVAFAWPVLLAFLRLATHPAVFERPLAAAEAGAVLEGWLARHAALVVQPSERHLALLRGLLADVGTAANLVNDAHLAALALEHGAEIVSFDHDFGRFTGVRWRSPGR